MEMFSVIYEDDAYLCHLQEVDGRAFFHSKVKKELSLSDVKRGRRAFGGIKSDVVDLGYERLYAVTPSPHFARLLGGESTYIQTLEIDGVTMEMIVWELK